MNRIERWVRFLGGAAGLASLTVAVAAMVRTLGRPGGRQEPGAAHLLRRPPLLVATTLFLTIGAVLWRPLPLHLGLRARCAALVGGAALFFGGLAIYLWGLATLGTMFGPASSFGVRLETGHRLVTSGPYAYLRHPMYAAIMVAAAGSLLLFRTWATLLWAVLMPGLLFRARREERVLALEFGKEWQTYTARVHAWRPGRRRG